MSDATGIIINYEDCNREYYKLKQKKSLRYVFFKLTKDNKEIFVDKIGQRDKSFEDFRRELPEDDCRFAVLDFEYNLEGDTRNKILYVCWLPDSATVKQKMLYTSSNDSLRQFLNGIDGEVQATDLDEFDYNTILKKFGK